MFKENYNSLKISKSLNKEKNIVELNQYIQLQPELEIPETMQQNNSLELNYSELEITIGIPNQTQAFTPMPLINPPLKEEKNIYMLQNPNKLGYSTKLQNLPIEAKTSELEKPRITQNYSTIKPCIKNPKTISSLQNHSSESTYSTIGQNIPLEQKISFLQNPPRGSIYTNIGERFPLEKKEFSFKKSLIKDNYEMNYKSFSKENNNHSQITCGIENRNNQNLNKLIEKSFPTGCNHNDQKIIEISNDCLYSETLKITNEFENSLMDKTNFFCNSRMITGIIENEQYIFCENCFRDYCKTCNKICHKICTNVDRKNIKPFLVIEHTSSCQCTHNINGETINNIKLDCFYYIFFFRKILKIEEVKKFYKSKNGMKFCSYCTSNHFDNDDSYDEIEGEDIICQCQSKKHSCFNCFDLFFSFYDGISKELVLSELKSKFDICLIKYFEKFYDKDSYSDYISLINYENAKFLCHNLIFNGMLSYSLSDEIELMDLLIEKLKKKDNYFYNNEKINMPLSYIYHFYRKYLFLYIGNVDENNIDVMTCQTRLKKLDENMNFYRYLREHYQLGKFFSIAMIRIIFERLLELKYFYITFSNGDFLVDFLRQFFQCYCFEEKEIIILLNIVKKTRFKYDQDMFNNEIRFSIDIIYNIAQNNLIDSFVLGYLQNHDNKIYEVNENILEKFYFYNYHEYFEDYFKKLFSDEKIYLRIPNNKAGNNIKNNSFYGEKIMYLNCLHFNFLRKYNGNLTLEKIESNNKTLIIKQFDDSLINSNTLANIVLQIDRINILNYKDDRIENFLNKILNDCLPTISLDQINNFDIFIEYLFYSLKGFYRNKDKNFKIDISQFINKQALIDISNIDIRKFEEEIKYLFYKVFIKCKKFESDNVLNKWNLTLFVFLSNKKNIQFIVNLRFINLLFVNLDYLISFIFIDEKSDKGKDLIWRFFYMIYKICIHNSELSAEFDHIIKNNFLNFLIE